MSSEARPDRQKLIYELNSAGYASVADDVRHSKHPGNTAATLEQIAEHAERHGLGTAAGIIRAAIIRAERDAGAELDAAINEQANAAARVIRDASAMQGGEPERLAELVGRLDRMANRLMDETGLDAADNLTWHVRQVIYNDPGNIAAVEQFTREHLAARDECPLCNGTGGAGGDADTSEPCNACEGGLRKRYPHQLGEQLSDWYAELAGVGGLSIMVSPRPGGGSRLEPNDEGSFELPELASVVLQAGLAWVNWDQLAREAIANMKAERAAGGSDA